MKRSLCFVFLFFILIWIFGYIYFLMIVDHYEKINHTCSHTKGIVVFTGGTRRLSKSLELLEQFPDKFLLISGVKNYHEIKSSLKKLSPSLLEKITVGYDAYNTHTNAMETYYWIKTKKIDSICLVTSLYHIPRSLLELKSFLKEEQITVIPVLPLTSWYRDFSYFLFLLSEYHKYFVTWLFMKI